jgi:hypothetical protein
MVDNTNWYIVGSTVALVAVTAYYAYQTRELARRPFTPYISASFNLATHDEQQYNIRLDITNVGTGTATNVRVEHSVPAHNITGQDIQFGAMQPGERHTLSLSVPMPQRGAHTQINLRYEFRDIFGRRYRRNEEITV